MGDPTAALILTVAGLTLLTSFLCSLFEAVLYSITPSQLELLKQRRVRGARRLARLKTNVEEPIAAILTINTIAHTVGAAWCGAMVGQWKGSQAVGVFTAIFTFLVLALTEIIPKSYGVRYAQSLGALTAWPLQLMVWLALPIARPAKAAMHLLTGPRKHEGPSEEEVLLFSGLAAKHGRVRSDEHRWLENALRLDKVRAADIRTPRTVVETLPADRLVSEVRGQPSSWIHSRVPLVEENNPDDVVGLVYRREVLDAAVDGKDELRLRDLMHPIHFVPETMPAHELLDHFIQKRQHMFAIADEYGGFEGVVTLEDVLESLLGAEIVDEHDEHEDLQEIARQRNPLESTEARPAGEDR